MTSAQDSNKSFSPHKSFYDHSQAELHWQKMWEDHQLFQDQANHFVAKEKSGEKLDPLYLLFAFAYPSGSGLHVGHVESKTALDIMARYKRMKGKDVFFPVGWDAFGLPAENYAIKTGVPPVETTKQAIHAFQKQVRRLGISYDWASEVATCHPEYYKFTQWLFLELFKAGLAYKKMGMVNWCPSCQTVLANEQVVDGLCERCDSQVVQKELEQWYFKITDYKDELIEGLEQLDWPEPTKQQQLHWIGKSTGAEVDFELIDVGNGGKQALTCFTTRIDTIFGVSFLVISPEKFNQLELMQLVADDKKTLVKEYLEQASKKTEEERRVGEKEKTGVNTGLKVINPVSGELAPLFVADYVLPHVGTGVVMGVPAHDERDWAFALKHNLMIVPVIAPVDNLVTVKEQTEQFNHQQPQVCTSEYGVLINSGQYNGLSSKEAQQKILADFSQVVRATTTYKLRDWLISRQRYWGAPIPIIYDPEGNPHLVKEKDLPWLLPTDVDFKPTGESPLVSSQEFAKRASEYAVREYGELIVQNQKNGWANDASDWRPEYDTMDTFVDSSWYYLRFLDARNQEIFADKTRLKMMMPVDFYLIGPEHIVLHLLYSRFFTKFLRDRGYLDLPSGEPFAKMRHQGMILGPDHKKMSKSKGNVISPDVVIERYGADTLRVYEMFMGPLEADKPWDDRAVQGVARFLSKIYKLFILTVEELEQTEVEKSHPKLEKKLHATIKKVGDDIEQQKFNTAIACLMEFTNDWQSLTEQKESMFNDGDLERVAKILAPLAPFLSEELWSKLGNEFSIHQQTWPEFNPALAQAETTVIPIQVNGKVRGELEIETDKLAQMTKEQILEQAKQLPSVQKWLVDQDGNSRGVKKEIYVSGKIVSLVV